MDKFGTLSVELLHCLVYELPSRPLRFEQVRALLGQLFVDVVSIGFAQKKAFNSRIAKDKPDFRKS